jgi:hypothetical protein
MSVNSDYHICITGLYDSFIPELDKAIQLVDFLDFGMYLDGPDRDSSTFVRISSRDIKQWSEFVRVNPEQPVQPLRRRYVYLTHSPIALDQRYRHYSELMQIMEGVTPREAGFIASLGFGTRRLLDVLHCPLPGDDRRWIQQVSVHLIRGLHPVWRRVWNQAEGRKEWELMAVKGFNLMLVCKLNHKMDIFTIEEYIEILRLKQEFTRFLIKVGQNINCLDFELMGEVSN